MLTKYASTNGMWHVIYMSGHDEMRYDMQKGLHKLCLSCAISPIPKYTQCCCLGKAQLRKMASAPVIATPHCSVPTTRYLQKVVASFWPENKNNFLQPKTIDTFAACVRFTHRLLAL